MTPFFIPSIHYHADDSAKVHNSNITTQSKIPSFAFEHLASYTLAGYDTTCQKQLSQSAIFLRVNTRTCALKIIHQPTFVRMRTQRDAFIADAIAKKESKQVN